MKHSITQWEGNDMKNIHKGNFDLIYWEGKKELMRSPGDNTPAEHSATEMLHSRSAAGVSVSLTL